MNSVVVLSVREGFRQVTMGTWGNPSGMFGGFTRSPDTCHVRRLTKNPAGANTIGTLVAWDICDTFPTKISASITNMYEQSYSGADKKTVKERWMANTGEYHILRGLQMNALNTAGARVSLLDPAQGSMEVFVSGARDRGYIAGNLQGNIYKNSPCTFEIALVNDATNEAIALGTLANNKNGTYSFEPSSTGLYTTTGSAKNSNKYSTDTVPGELFKDNRIWLDSTGNVTGIVDGKPGYYLGIRPESSAAARPGDDLLLTLGIRSEGEIKAFNFTYKKPDGTNESKPAEVTLSEADYLAVYDKKMLWRANLYIDEGNLDWNNVHPWNAPPDGVVTATTPKWWTADWGNNEWNYSYSGDSYFASMTTLQPGHGNQVIATIPDSIWYYRTAEPDETKVISARVAYDHQGWDDPFSFGKKMQSQSQYLNQYYSANGELFQKPVINWKEGAIADWKLNNVSLTDAQKLAEMKSCLPNTNVYQANADLAKITELFLGFRDNTSKRWNKDYAKAPFGIYKNYVHPSQYNDNVVPYNKASFARFSDATKAMNDTLNLDGAEYHPYVPGLSDSMMTTSEYPEALIGRYTAGTDCVGFIQRTHIYSGSTYSAVNGDSYRRAPFYWTGGSIPDSAMGRFHNSAHASNDVTLGSGKEVPDTTTADPDDTIRVYEQFKYLVPGDVVWYSGHIMLIARIDLPSGPDGRYIRENIKIIESVYTRQGQGSFGVVNGRTVNDLWYTNAAGVATNRLWEIWRQK